MLKFISFGSGSSGNCYYLYTDTDGLMIDAGIGSRMLKKYFKEYGLSLSQLHNVLVTHDHADHVKSVGSVCRDCCVPVYATEKVHKGIVRNYCVKYKVPTEQQKTIEKNVPLQLGDFTITPFDVPHDSSDNVGYKIECEGKTFVLMTDVGHFTDEMTRIIGEADYLVIEANYDLEMLRRGSYPAYLKQRITNGSGHTCNNDCAEMIATNATPRLKHVWLCHLSAENNHPELALKTVETVLAQHGIVAGRDFELDVLKRTNPTGVYELTGNSPICRV